MDLVQRLKPKHLRLLDAIARHRQLQRAATALAMSQPAASRILAELETELGTPVFRRHPRGMEPTPVGEALLRHVRVILWEFETLQSEVEAIAGGQAGPVRIGAVTGPAMGVLMPALRAVRAQSPDIEPTISVSPSVDLVRGLREGRFDFVIARLPPEQDSDDFHILPARNENVALLVRDSHPLAGRRGLHLADLGGFEWVVQERGSPIRQAVEDAFLLAGTPVPRLVTNSSSLLVVLSLLAHGTVISPQSEEVAELLTGDGLGARLVALDLAREMTVSPYFVLTNRGRQLPRASERVLNEVLRRL